MSHTVELLLLLSMVFMGDIKSPYKSFCSDQLVRPSNCHL